MASSSSDIESRLKNVPDKYLIAIAEILAGRINDSHAVETFNDPILKPSIKSVYWLFIIQYTVLAILGIISNVAIMAYVMYHKTYKDITHAFIVNLALCHFVQCSIVLPITLMVMLLQNWIFGQFLCFFLPLLQDIPLHVAMISHILIAWDRLRWLGDPLRGRLPAFVCCCASWLTGMVIALPYPIYTTYLELGDYIQRLNGVGLCIVNLVDDMHEYMRGLFVIMYCGPTILLAYLYIRTARELRPPDGPFAVMMFEHRADIRNKQRSSSTSSGGRPGRTGSTRSYDLYSAELDVSREKRTQRNLGSMAAAQVLCVCPLMILRLAKMVVVETYENSKHFDFTYLMFVWIAFLPTVIFPSIYASEILPGTDKERLRGYLRLSSKRKKSRNSQEESIEQENTSTTIAAKESTPLEISKDDKNRITIISDVQKSTSNSTIMGSGTQNHQQRQHQHINRSQQKTLERQNSQTQNRQQHHSQSNKQQNHNNNGNNSSGCSTSHSNQTHNLSQHSRSKNTSSTVASANNATGNLPVLLNRRISESTNNSFSNITSSTYCNNGTEYNGSIDFENTSILSGRTDKDSFYDKAKWVNSALCHKDLPLSDCGSFTRHDSSGTLDRDLEIIDLLERERSMDIQDMMERERHGEIVRNISLERRKLPDLEKICKSPKDAYIYGASNPSQIPLTSGTTSGYLSQEQQHKAANYIASSTRSSLSGRSRKESLQSNNDDNNLYLREENRDDDMIIPNSSLDSPHHHYNVVKKKPVIENRLKRNSRGSGSSKRSSSIKSKDYTIPNNSELDFRENVFAHL